MAFYASNPDVRARMNANPEAVRAAYNDLILNEDFQEAVESDTAGVPHTVTRIRLWGEMLNQQLGTAVQLPQAADNTVVFEAA